MRRCSPKAELWAENCPAPERPMPRALPWADSREGDYFAIAGRRHQSEMVDGTAIRWSRIHRRQHSGGRMRFHVVGSAHRP